MKTFKYKINGTEYNVSVDQLEDTLAKVEVNGTSYEIELEKKVEEDAPKVARPVVKASAPAGGAPAGGGAGAVKSPLPGIVVAIEVSVGDVVKKGQTVAILEAMKMENTISAPMDGKVTAINIGTGESILEGVTILTIG